MEEELRAVHGYVRNVGGAIAADNVLKKTISLQRRSSDEKD